MVIKGIPPRVTLARDCAVVPVPVGCNNYPTHVGSQAKLFGSVRLGGAFDTSTVFVSWGDGSGSSRQIGTYALNGPGNGSLSLTPQPSNNYRLDATHTYAKAGLYTVTVTARNTSGTAHSSSIVQAIHGPQEITFGQLEDRQYGAAFTATATGGPSGFPVTFTAGPADVCTADGAPRSRPWAWAPAR